jgi:hypothetical protein
MRVRALVLITAVAVAFAGMPAPAGEAAASKSKHKHGKKHKERKAKKKQRHAKPAPEPAPQPAPEPRKPVSFDGSCDFAAVVKFTPAMTNTPQPVAQSATATGTCTGTFTDGKGSSSALDAAPVTYAASSSGEAVSCLAGTATGAGQLVFPGGALGIAFSETRVAATPLLELTGNAGGKADGVGTPSQSQDPAAAVQDCGGTGLKEFALDAHFEVSHLSG